MLKIQEEKEKERKNDVCGTMQAAQEGREKKSLVSKESTAEREKYKAEIGSHVKTGEKTSSLICELNPGPQRLKACTRPLRQNHCQLDI